MNVKISGFKGKNNDYSNSRLSMAKAIILLSHHYFRYWALDVRLKVMISLFINKPF
jgi:hypothetical protein